MQKLIYPSSLIVIAVAMFLIVNYRDSGRMNMIAGSLFTLGFTLNIVGYFVMKKPQVKIS